MEMDRQTLTVLFGAIIVLTLIGTSFFAPATKAQHEADRPAYAADDIRYKYQKEASKASRKGMKSVPVEEDSSSGGDSETDESAEAAPAEEPEADASTSE